MAVASPPAVRFGFLGRTVARPFLRCGAEDVVDDWERESVKLLRNGMRRSGRAGSGTARLTVALALTGLLFAALAAFGAARYATSAAAQAIPPGGAQYDQYKPGWGCGDRNHVHTGPPGRQYGTTPPPGCMKAQAATTRAKARCSAKVSKAKAKANSAAKKAKATKRKCGKAKVAKTRATRRP
jgi:hypothetical protein